MRRRIFVKHVFERPKADLEEKEKDVVSFVRGRLGLDLDSQQERLLREGGGLARACELHAAVG